MDSPSFPGVRTVYRKEILEGCLKEENTKEAAVCWQLNSWLVNKKLRSTAGHKFEVCFRLNQLWGIASNRPARGSYLECWGLFLHVTWVWLSWLMLIVSSDCVSPTTTRQVRCTMLQDQIIRWDIRWYAGLKFENRFPFPVFWYDLLTPALRCYEYPIWTCHIVTCLTRHFLRVRQLLFRQTGSLCVVSAFFFWPEVHIKVRKWWENFIENQFCGQA